MKNKELVSLFRESNELNPTPKLKDKILAQTSGELKERQLNKKHYSFSRFMKRFAPLAVCFVLLFGVIGGVIGIKNEHYQTVYVDVNPSIVFHVNRFGKVSGVDALNEDAKKVVNDINIKGSDSESALEEIICSFDKYGYFLEDAELYISVSSKKDKDADKLLQKLYKKAEQVKGNKKYKVNTQKLSKEDREDAKDSGMSPGKYKVIKEIIERYPNLNVRELEDMSMSELKSILNQNKTKEPKK